MNRAPLSAPTVPRVVPKAVPVAPPGTRWRVPRLAAWFLWAAFAAMLLGPLLKSDFGGGARVSAMEKRNLAAFPRWSWRGEALAGFPKAFEAAFNDHFGFREPMVRALSLLKVRFRLSLLAKPGVVQGREGWLYLAGTVREARGLKRAKPGEAGAWARYVRARKEWLAARGVGYLFVIVPNKEWVYPEFLPEGMAPRSGRRFSDRLAERLAREPDLPVLDLRRVLVDAKKKGLVFERTDTHWSQLGAFLATNWILERLRGDFLELAPVPLEARRPVPYRETGPGGDLAMMLSLPDVLREERLVIKPRPGAFAAVPPRIGLGWPKGSYFALPAAFESGLPECRHRLLLVGNSFTDGLLRYLPEHFRRVTRLRPVIPYSHWFHERLAGMIEAEKPSVYVEVLSERHLYTAPEVASPLAP